MRHVSALAAVLFLLLVTPLAAQTFVFDLSGAQEVPPVPTTATGGCHGVLDQPAATFSITCTHNVQFATVMHIHRAPAGANGPVAFDMGDPTVQPVVATWSSMTPADIADLLAGNLYVNVHTAGRPAGEIRGQIVQGTVDLVAFVAEGEQVVPPNESAAVANCTADLDSGATSIAVACTHNLAAPVSAHIHNAPFGTNGPIVYTFASPASPLSATVPLSPALVAAFAAKFLYLDLHTAPGTEEDPSEEIRGQIGLPPAAATSGTVIIAKETAPGGGSGFGFSESITSGTFTLNDGGTETFASVTAGTYTITETALSGYTLGDVSCDDANSTGDTAARTATVRVEGGETVRCTFRNFETAPADTLFVFHLSGDQEVPPVPTTDRGGCMGRFDAAAAELSLICTHDVDLPTVMHIHRGAAGVNGPIAFDMGQPDSPVIATWSGMTAADVADLLAGDLYLNIHTAGRPAGEIRGQIVTRTVDTVAFTANTAQTVPPGTSPSTASCTADLAADATSLAINCTHDVASPSAAHVHQAPRGENGPVVFTFPSPANPIGASMPLTPRLVADFAAYFLYLDIHGPEVGEEANPIVIRGQIAASVTAPATGTVVIRKATAPAGGAGFTFTQNITGSGAFTLNDGGEEPFANVAAGTYTVTENVPPGWSLSDVTCGDNDSTGNPFAGSATVRLQAGETVVCTFTNLQSAAAPSQFVFHLSGGQEVPPTSSTARGGCYGQFESASSRLTLLCTHNVVSPAIAHIHRAPAGSNGPIAFDLGDPTSPMEAVWNMTPADVADLTAGRLYVNVHASGRPDGEIRGQILPRTVDRFHFTANASQEVPPTDSTATGQCLADLGDNPTSLFVQCTHNVAAPTMIHLHAAPPGVDGPVIADFPLGSTFQGTVPLTPRLIADFAAGFLYVNIHSADYETGEIRGQLLGVAAPAILAPIPTLGEWAALLLLLSLAAVAWTRMR